MIINVAKQSISISSPEALVSNSVGQYMARISFSDEWKDFDKIVVFRNSETSIEQAVDAQTEIIVPWEVLQKKGTLEVGAYGLKGTEKRPTIWSKPLVILQGVEEGETAHEPTILPWEEIVRRIGQLADLDTENKSSLVGAINEVLSTVPAFLSELTPDAEHMTVSQAEKNAWNGKADPEDIPHNVSDLNNDAGYITEEDIPEVPVSSVNGKTGAVVLSAEDVHALPEDTPIPEITASAINNALGYTAADNADVQENAQEISQINESITEIQTNKADKSEIPNVPVKSVSAGGESLTPDASGNVDVPYFSSTRAGVIRSSFDFGVQNVTDGRLRTRPLTASEYAKAYGATFVGKGTLDNVLATPSIMPTLTADEQAAARSRIMSEQGTGDLLATFTIDEDVKSFDIDFGFKVANAFIAITVPKNPNTTANGSVAVRGKFDGGNAQIGYDSLSNVSVWATFGKIILSGQNIKPLTLSGSVGANYGNGWFNGNNAFCANSVLNNDRAYGYIHGISTNAYAADSPHVIPAGTAIRVYGIKIQGA